MEVFPHSAQILPNTWHSGDSQECLQACRCDLCLCPLSGYVFVDFSSEEEVKKALKCNREYMGKDTGTGARPVRSFTLNFDRGSAASQARPWALGRQQRAEQAKIPALVQLT